MIKMDNKTESSGNNIKEIKDSSDNKQCLIPGYEKIEDFTKDGFKVLIEATRNSNALPQDREWNFYNTHDSFKNLMASEGNEILQMINSILKLQGINKNIKSRDLEEKVELIIEANDNILERVANNLDELSGIRKKSQLPVEIQTVSAEIPISGSWNKINSAKITVEPSTSTEKSIQKQANSIRLLTGKNIQRSQKFFKDRIDNSKSPWEPRIKDKPNNIKPLAIYLEYSEDGLSEIFCHPYEIELERFEPSADLLKQASPVFPRPLSETPLKMVKTTEDLNLLIEDLRKYNEIAVDLEHHSYRTYMGITCLMQISTANTDYIVDTLALRDKLHILNEIFTKPTVVKVFHGADSDILWLQRDLSLYIVNMFDTYQAAKQLGYPQLSLAYLLNRFCKVDANKHFQLADWRIRPLPDELLTYARSDTHYLLYIYHMLRNALLLQGENVLKMIFYNSTQVCKKRYEKPIIRDDSHMELYRRCKKLFDNRQMYALKHLYVWRDNIAREEDESIGYVLPNHMMLQIAELLPREMQGILACCNPIPPLVRANLLELHKIILKAREQSVVKTILTEENRSRGSTQSISKANYDHVLNCPHDLPKTRGPDEFRDELPTLLGSILNLKKENAEEPPGVIEKYVSKPPLPFENTNATIKIFDSLNSENNLKTDLITSPVTNVKFLGPYERYKMVKTYLQYQDKKQQEEKNKGIPNHNKSSEERTDEDRINALKEHFKRMNETNIQLIPLSKSDVSEPKGFEIEKEAVVLGHSSQKRKRSESSSSAAASNDDDNKNTSSTILVEESDPNNECDMLTLNPNQQSQKKKKNKKNKNKPTNELNQSLNQQNKRKRKSKRIKNTFNSNENSSQQSQQQNEYNEEESYSQQDNYNNYGNNYNQQNNRQQQQQRRGVKRKFNKSPSKNNNSRNEQFNNSPRKQQKQQQQSQEQWNQEEKYTPFDYSAVDFQQFQGGAGSAHQNPNVASNFKSKGSKNKRFDNIGRNNTRSGTFGGGGNNRGKGKKRGGRWK